MGARAYIGISGWNYDGWKDDFYRGVPRRRWLAHAAGLLTGIEINATHYREQRAETFRRWRAEVPPGFRFAAKGHRFVTHFKKLRDVGDSIARARDNFAPLESALAAVVWQLPADLERDDDRLRAFLADLDAWTSTRHAIEFRHRSWFQDEVAELLAAHRVAACQSDSPRFALWDAVTTDLVYVRLHGHTRAYASRYSDPLLAAWAGRCRRWLAEGRDVHVYFDNDAEGHAPKDALRLLERLSSASSAARARSKTARSRPAPRRRRG